MPGWRASPLPKDWPQRRLRILIRDGYRCRIQGPGCTGLATEVDHGGDRDDHRDEMLRAACTTCHRRRTGRQARAAQGGRRERPEQRHPGLI